VEEDERWLNAAGLKSSRQMHPLKRVSWKAGK